MSISRISSFGQLDELLQGAEVRGSIVYGSDGSRLGNVGDLSTKLKQLFESEVLENSDPLGAREAAQELRAVLFVAENLPQQQNVVGRLAKRVFGEPFENIKRAAIAHARQDSALMGQIGRRYNELARDWNVRVNMYAEDPQAAKSPEMKQLRYLNSFLGIAWSKGQEAGHDVLPLYGEMEGMVSELSSSIYKPSQCGSMQQLASLVTRAAEKLEIFPESMITTVEDRIVELYKHESRLDSYSKGPMALETMAVIYDLDLHRPDGSSRPRKLQRIMQQCQSFLAQDSALQQKVALLYDSAAIEINDQLLAVSGSEEVELPKWKLQQAAFFGEALGLEVPLPGRPNYRGYIATSSLLPESRLGMSSSRLSEMQRRTTQAILLLNLHSDMARVRQRLERVESQLDGTNLSSLLLDEAKLAELRQERWDLKRKLLGMPPQMPKAFFTGLWQQQVERLELLGVELSAAQRAMAESLPLIGLDQPSTLPFIPEHGSLQLPAIAKLHNIWADIANNAEIGLELKRDVQDCELYIQDMPIWQLIRSDNDLQRLDEAREKLEQWVEGPRQFTREWMYNTVVNFRAKLLQAAELFPMLEITREHVLGQKPWPTLDISKLPFPATAVLAAEIKHAGPTASRLMIERTWPKEWQEQIPPDLQLLLEASKDT